MKVQGIDHIVIAVKDIDKAADFFSRLFDTEFEESQGPEGVGVRTKMCAEGIELISPLTSGGAVARFLQTKGEGLYALSFRVENVDRAAEDAQKAGVRVIGRAEEDRVGTSSVINLRELFLHPKDAYGVHLLLTEYQRAEERGQ